jgi:hypothetical protein
MSWLRARPPAQAGALTPDAMIVAGVIGSCGPISWRRAACRREAVFAGELDLGR